MKSRFNRHQHFQKNRMSEYHLISSMRTEEVLLLVHSTGLNSLAKTFFFPMKNLFSNHKRREKIG